MSPNEEKLNKLNLRMTLKENFHIFVGILALFLIYDTFLYKSDKMALVFTALCVLSLQAQCFCIEYNLKRLNKRIGELEEKDKLNRG